jgi:hypothetical protein
MTPKIGLLSAFSVIDIAESATIVRYFCQALSCGWYTAMCIPFLSNTLGQDGTGTEEENRVLLLAGDACCARKASTLDTRQQTATKTRQSFGAFKIAYLMHLNGGIGPGFCAT